MLIIIAASIKGVISINLMALVVASLAWMYPTRTIRAQVLTLRERATCRWRASDRAAWRSSSARCCRTCCRTWRPASSARSHGAVLASIGLEALGLGPQNEPTIGMTIYWAHHLQRADARHVVVVGAADRGDRGPVRRPVPARSGLDEIANPRPAEGAVSDSRGAAT